MTKPSPTSLITQEELTAESKRIVDRMSKYFDMTVERHVSMEISKLIGSPGLRLVQLINDVVKDSK